MSAMFAAVTSLWATDAVFNVLLPRRATPAPTAGGLRPDSLSVAQQSTPRTCKTGASRPAAQHAQTSPFPPRGRSWYRAFPPTTLTTAVFRSAELNSLVHVGRRNHKTLFQGTTPTRGSRPQGRPVRGQSPGPEDHLLRYGEPPRALQKLVQRRGPGGPNPHGRDRKPENRAGIGPRILPGYIEPASGRPQRLRDAVGFRGPPPRVPPTTTRGWRARSGVMTRNWLQTAEPEDRAY